MKRTVPIALAIITSLVFSGCLVGTIPGDTIAYNKRQSIVSRNNKNLITLKIGMSQDQVLQNMGQPERSEGYEWGSAYLYRTAMTSGIYGTADTDFTPVVFDEKGILVGWGRNFFTEHVKRYEIKIKKD
jgi:outer membrane protein assembly factor BamE (lipoprotein component of BamABCDE complex)